MTRPGCDLTRMALQTRATTDPLPAGSDLTPARPAEPKTPVTTEQCVDVDTWTVQIHADPTPELLTRLCHDLDRHSGLRALIAHVAADNPEHQRALRELAVILADTFTWTLTKGQAEDLGGDIYEATTIPDQCQYDEKFAVTKIFGVPMCHGHAAAHDRMVEEAVKA